MLAAATTTAAAVALLTGPAAPPGHAPTTPAVDRAAREVAATTVALPPAAAQVPAPAAVPAGCPPRAAACVDRGSNQAWLQHRGRVTYGPVPVSLGGRGHRTPTGIFRVAWKAPHWVSTEYGIPMPWSVFFAAGGIAFHAGPLDRRSHGCVHLRRRAARTFFADLDVGDVVAVR